MTKSYQKIEYSSKHLTLRKVLFVVFILVALFSFGYAVKNMLEWEAGYRQIEAEGSYGDEVELRYYTESKSEYNKVKKIYDSSCKQMYELLDESNLYDDVINIAYFNQNINTKVQVDEKLYKVFEKLASYDNRTIYLGPVYEIYKGIFSCTDDYQLAEFDPLLNEDINQELKQLLVYLNSDEHIKINLYEDNYVELYVSDEYKQYIDEHGYSCYLDLYWIKNNFIIDDVADSLLAQGYDKGLLSCYNGYYRFLSSDSVMYHYYDLIDGNIGIIADIDYSQPTACVFYRSYQMFELDSFINYTLADGSVRTCYVSNDDGYSKAPISSLTVYSEEKDCSTLVLESMKYYISDDFDTESIKGEDFNYFYVNDKTLNYNDRSLIIENLYTGYQLNYVE